MLESNRSLQRLAQPVATPLAQRAAGLQSVVILSDASGLVLQTFGNSAAMEKAQSFALEPGNIWSESGRGTNAIGTALAIDDSCEVEGRQHYLTRNQGFVLRGGSPTKPRWPDCRGAGYFRPGAYPASPLSGVDKRGRQTD